MSADVPGPLVKVCGLLNEVGAQYVVAGAYAMILHGLIRATEDVDILVENSPENLQRVIDALSRLEDGAASELVPSDFVENIAIKVADEVEVDVTTQAWTVTYLEAAPTASRIEVEGIRIPFLSLPDLIRSKLTYRDQDRIDVERLRRLQS